MEEQQQRTEIGSIGEFGLIRRLTKNAEPKNPTTILGIGDDAAVIDTAGAQTVITTDLLLEGVHFDLMYTPLRHLGYKAVVVNLSDVYAMMATPTQVTVSIGVSNRFSVEALEEFYAGVNAACNRYGADLVGGDTASSQKGFIISVTALGIVAENAFVTRSGARPNDLIVVSGNLGAAYMGLQLLEREKKIFLESPSVQPTLEGRAYAVGRLLKPEPRADIVAWLLDNDIRPTAMIDVSDGLSSELLHLCRESGIGCLLQEEKIPIHEETEALAAMFHTSATACALSGGEDYELLFTIAQEDYEKISRHKDLSVIGYMTNKEDDPILVSSSGNKHLLTAQGWNAFDSDAAA